MEKLRETLPIIFRLDFKCAIQGMRRWPVQFLSLSHKRRQITHLRISVDTARLFRRS